MENILFFNPDMTDEDIDEKLGAVAEEGATEPAVATPQQPAFGGLRKLGSVGA